MAKTVVLEDDHQSGRYDAVPRQRLAMNHQIAQTAHLAVITEYQGLKWLIHGWGEHGTESRIVWDQSFWKPRAHGHVSIPTVDWKRGTSKRSSLDIPWVFLEAVDFDLTMLRGGGHTPAHLSDPAQARANEQVLQGLAQKFRPIIGDHHPDQVSLSFDFNRKLTLARNADLINHAAKPLGLHLLVPPGTTHRPANRIDGFLVSKGTDKQEMLDWVPGFDHRGVQRKRRVRAAAA